MTDLPKPDLKYLFEPRSIAFVGASGNVMKSGGLFLYSLLADKFEGAIYPVNPKEQEIMGLKCYASVCDIQGDVDLAILTVPAKGMLAAVEDCARKRVKFAVVHAAGFGEIDPAGKELEAKMVAAAHAGGLRLIGPNCMGVFTSKGRMNTIVPHVRVPNMPGGVAMVGQSGWTAEVMVEFGFERGLRFSGVVSIGNQCDLKVQDLFEYWGNDPETKVILAYVEGIKDARNFMEIAKKVSLRKPICIWKGGSSERGAKSSASHTGSLAMSHSIYQAMCRETGIIEATGLEDLMDLGAAFSCPVVPTGNKMGLVVDAGGGAIACIDIGSRLGLEVPRISAEAEKRIVTYLEGRVPPSANRNNPVDLVWISLAEAANIYTTALENVLPEVDFCMLIGYAQLKDDNLRKALSAVRDRFKKPIFWAAGNPSTQVAGTAMNVADGNPSYLFPDNAMRCIGAMVHREQFLKKARAEDK